MMLLQTRDHDRGRGLSIKKVGNCKGNGDEMFPDCQCLKDCKLLVEMKVPREERWPLWNGWSRPAVIEAAPCIPIYIPTPLRLKPYLQLTLLLYDDECRVQGHLCISKHCLQKTCLLKGWKGQYMAMLSLVYSTLLVGCVPPFI